MAQESKVGVSLLLPPGEAVAAMKALNRVEAHVLKIAPHWSALTEEQRKALLEHSPVLARFLALAQEF